MTDCQHEDCDRDAVGLVVWEANQLPREYCQKHIRDCQAEYPEAINRVESRNSKQGEQQQ